MVIFEDLQCKIVVAYRNRDKSVTYAGAKLIERKEKSNELNLRSGTLSRMR